jgi:glycosyltransferase involved in cell wall biosynthesis
MNARQPLRVLYSFPLSLGAGRICTTAWYQIDGLAKAGAQVEVLTASIRRPLLPNVKVRQTLARGKMRLPNRLFSRTAFGSLHDWIVARYVEKNADRIDIIHAWPLGCLRTLEVARRLGIPTVLERCNAHTRFAYEVVNAECNRLGVPLPPDHEHAWNDAILRREEAEFNASYRLLCPSEFVVKTFVDKGFSREKLVRHIYGYDEKMFFPPTSAPKDKKGVTMISVGVCAVRKGLHFALEAWLRSPASQDGTFLIAGDFLPAYQQKLASMLAHPSVKVLGHRNDVPELVRQSDLLVLPSIEEGFGLVCTEAMASGCVPLVSDACTDLCRHMDNSLVHPVADVNALAQQITSLHQDRALLARLRKNGLDFAPSVTWDAAGEVLLDVYREVVTTGKSTSTEYALAS